MNRPRFALLLIWIATVVAGLGWYLLHRERFTPESIATLLRDFSGYLLLAYLAVSVARAFFLIPSTPFVLAGGLLFPQQPLTVLAVSMAGIALSATLLYQCSDWLGFGRHFEKLSASAHARLEQALRSRLAFVYLVLWAFFPLVPTDAACYVAGMVRMNFWKFIGAICLGELVICSVYVALGRGLWEFLTSAAL